MGFKSEEFMASRMVPRTEEVDVPDMAEWFGDGDKPVWKVRGLTGKELGRADVAAVKNKELKAVLDGLMSKNSKRITKAIEKMIQPDVTEEDAKRIAYFQYGSVEPEGSEELAVKVWTAFPVEFRLITNRILALTGKGHEPGEPKPSGTTTKSEVA